MQRVEEATMENMNPWTEMEPWGRTKNKTWRDHLTQTRRMWNHGGQRRRSRRKGAITGVKHSRGHVRQGLSKCLLVSSLVTLVKAVPETMGGREGCGDKEPC